MKKIIITALGLALLVASCQNNKPKENASTGANSVKDNSNNLKGVARDTLVTRLVRAGELELTGDNQAELDSYFDTSNFKFHGPDGFNADYSGLNDYFKSIRAAFDNRSIRRGIIVAEGNYISCQTWIEGTFVREFTQSPAGPLKPNGNKVTFELINIFRFDDKGRLVEEWVTTDNRSLMKQLGAEGK